MLLLFMGYLTETFLCRWSYFLALVIIGATACNRMEDCSAIADYLRCNIETHQCVCTDGTIYFSKESKCVEGARLGEQCELSEQCQKTDPYSICHFFDEFYKLMTCQCKSGYKEREINGKRRCIPVARLGELCELSEQCQKSDAYSICHFSNAFHHLMTCQCRSGYKEEEIWGKRRCIPAPKRNNFLGSPHFDSGDAVPIVMGCLAAGLALAACCAGIVQLMRKKNSRSFRREDSQHPHESVALNGFGAHPVINGTPIIPPTAPPPSLPPYECPPIEDLPPSYEEAIKQCAPVEAVPISEPNKM